MGEADYLVSLGLMVYRKRVGERPADRRSLREVAAETGINQSTLYRVERGTHTPDLETFRKICLWLGASADELLGLRQECRADRDRPQDTPAGD